MAILYSTGDDEMQMGEHLKRTGVFSTPAALSFLVFSMLYMPCVATIFTIKRESGAWRWALFSVAYSIAIAWIVAFTVFHLLDSFQ
jgi:ferrous iron transport protein B